MPGKPGMFLPGMPCHVIQRGNNRDVTFYSEQDRYLGPSNYTAIFTLIPNIFESYIVV